jgi:membrane protein
MATTETVSGGRKVARRIREEARTADRREVIDALLRAYRDNDLLTYASAISFQVLFALIPLLLFALGLLGFLSLDEAWQQDIAPDVEQNVSGAAYEIIDDTVTHVLTSQQLFWVTAGAAIATWEISGAVRAVMQVFNRIYGSVETRPFWRRIRISLALAAVSGLLILLAAAVARFGPELMEQLVGGAALIGVAATIVSWAVGLALLVLVVGMLVHYAPDLDRPLHWVSFGALLVVIGWSVMSLGFSVYVTQVADYDSIFGSLATIIVTMTYLYTSAIVFLTGVQIDALVQGGFSQDDVPTVDRAKTPAAAAS